MKYILTVLMAFSVTFQEGAKAQVCLGGHDREDRSYVIQEEPGISNILLTMLSTLQLAFDANRNNEREAAGRLVQTFNGLREVLTRSGSDPQLFLGFTQSERTRDFFKTLTSAEFLNIPTIISGSKGAVKLDPEVINAMLDAYDATSKAVTTIVPACLHGSWDRIVLDGAENDGECGGGYDTNDRDVIRYERRAAAYILREMLSITRVHTTDDFSVGQRRITDLDLEFLVAELELAGSSPSAPVSGQTKQFLEAVIDPIFLGLSDIKVTGDGNTTARASQAVARRSYAKVRRAYATLRRCTR